MVQNITNYTISDKRFFFIKKIQVLKVLNNQDKEVVLFIVSPNGHT